MAAAYTAPARSAGMTPRRMFGLGLLGVLGLIVVIALLGMWKTNDAEDIMVIQSPISGQLTWYQTAGLKWQGWGKVTTYHKRSQFWFSAQDDQGDKLDQSISVRFNDGGHGNISGSVAWEMPTDEALLTALHTKYGSHHAIEQQLVRTVVEKSVYMTGPLMSSKESYAERRNELIRFIEDQIMSGVYKTRTYQKTDKDPLSGQPRLVNVVELLPDAKEPGGYARQDVSPLSIFGVKTFNLSINNVGYDQEVENQIKAQQQAIMQIQTASAKAREAEQQAITAEQNGRAEAAKSKWEQEVIKAKVVTEAQQKLEVAQLDVKTAAQYKAKRILEAEADAEYKRKIIVADGALTQKLEVYQAIMVKAVEGLGSQRLTPDITIGGDGKSNGANTIANTMDIIGTKILKDLQLDMSVPRGNTTKK